MKSDDKVIGGFRYRMTQVGAETGEQIALRLGLPVAAFFAAAVANGVTETSISEAAIGGLGPAIAALTGENLRFCREHFAANTIVWLPDGKVLREWPLTEVYDDHFSGRYAEAAQWFAWGVSMNRFFGSALERVAEKLKEKKTESDSASPPESPGGSGGSSSKSPEARA